MQPPNNIHKLAIVGAGIAGLSSAIACAPFIPSITLFEQAPQLHEVGAGLQLMPNATRALASLGVPLDEVLRPSYPQNLYVLNAKTGKILTQVSLSAISQRANFPYICVHRADLLAALALKTKSFANIIVQTNTALSEAFESQNHLNLKLNSSGQTIEAKFDYAIGADGIWSKVRQSLHPNTSTRNSHRIAYRTHIETHNLPQHLRENVHLFLHPSGFHMVCYPMRAGTLLNVVLCQTAQAQNPTQPSALHDKWSEEPQLILNQVQSWLAWPLHDLNPITSATSARTLLVGDAAHAVLPHMAQGAAQALVDAQCLQQNLQNGHALATHMPQRLKAAQRVQVLSRRNGQIYALSGLPAIVRNIALRNFGNSEIEKTIMNLL